MMDTNSESASVATLHRNDIGLHSVIVREALQSVAPLNEAIS
jgi:hypothetical protein